MSKSKEPRAAKAAKGPKGPDIAEIIYEHGTPDQEIKLETQQHGDATATYVDFKQLFENMKPNLCRVAPISLSNLKKSNDEDQAYALNWLRAIQRTVYRDLMEVVNCMPKERWELHTRLGNTKLDEMKLRKERESTLRIAWYDTMPHFLRRSRHTPDE